MPARRDRTGLDRPAARGHRRTRGERALGARGGVVTGGPPGPARRPAPPRRRRSARCLVHLADGTRHEAYVDRVGADFLEGRATAGEARPRAVRRARRRAAPRRLTPADRDVRWPRRRRAGPGRRGAADFLAGAACSRSTSAIASVMCLRTIVRGSRSRSSRSAYSGPSSVRSSSRAALAVRGPCGAAGRPGARGRAACRDRGRGPPRGRSRPAPRSPTSNMGQNLRTG